MSIPGLGRLAPEPTAASAKRTVVLAPFSEWRFQVPRATSSVTVRLIQGTADRDGTELARNRPYTFTRTKSRIFTLQGCTLEVTGDCESSVAQYDPEGDSPLSRTLELHSRLHYLRKRALIAVAGISGPRVLVCGSRYSGKTTLVRTLTAWGTKLGMQPLVVNLDPNEGMLSLPGTVSSAVFGTIMDLEEPAGGFGIRSTPSSGPSHVPVKLPIAYHYGREKVADDPQHWKDVTSKLASSVRAKLKDDLRVRASGILVDMPAVDASNDRDGLILHVVKEFNSGFFCRGRFLSLGLIA